MNNEMYGRRWLAANFGKLEHAPKSHVISQQSAKSTTSRPPKEHRRFAHNHIYIHKSNNNKQSNQP